MKRKIFKLQLISHWWWRGSFFVVFLVQIKKIKLLSLKLALTSQSTFETAHSLQGREKALLCEKKKGKKMRYVGVGDYLQKRNKNIEKNP